MLSPILVATWIAYCAPLSEPLLLHALVHAGSGGDPWLVSDAGGEKLGGATEAEATRILREAPADKELYIGLTQIPRSSLRTLGLPAELALDACTNLRVGYLLFTSAHDYATTVEKTPWKILSIAFSYYRTRQRVLESGYVTKAVDFVRAGNWTAPAPFGSRLYFTIAAEASTAQMRLMSINASHYQLDSLAASSALARRIGGIY